MRNPYSLLAVGLMLGVGIGAALLSLEGCDTPAGQAAFDAKLDDARAKADVALDIACRADKVAHPGGKILADAALAATGNGAVIPLASGLDAAAYTAFQASCDALSAVAAQRVVPPAANSRPATGP